MSDYTLNLTADLYQYLLENSLREPDILKQLRTETHKLPGAEMQISPEQGQFMALLIQLMGAKKTLDIGTFTGYSALVVALALPKEGRVITCDVDKNATAFAQQFWRAAQVDHKITLELAPAELTLQKLLDEDQTNTFDFIFIDADKINYPIYYEKSLLLLRQGGLIAIDNVLWGGKVADPESQDTKTELFRKLNSALHYDKRIVLSMLPVGDGLTLALKR